jgi:DNA mismatch endonuclease (patch repair protein)
MVDIVSPEVRSRMMSGIRGKNTRPEIVVRQAAHRMGLRFRIHRKDLPGKPDLVFTKYKTVVFVHGCFWHRHNCRLAAVPKTRPEFWEAKFKANVDRDLSNRTKLELLGWRVIEIWECETREVPALEAKLKQISGDA